MVTTVESGWSMDISDNMLVIREEKWFICYRHKVNDYVCMNIKSKTGLSREERFAGSQIRRANGHRTGVVSRFTLRDILKRSTYGLKNSMCNEDDLSTNSSNNNNKMLQTSIIFKDTCIQNLSKKHSHRMDRRAFSIKTYTNEAMSEIFLWNSIKDIIMNTIRRNWKKSISITMKCII
jgi:hypothetical protein